MIDDPVDAPGDQSYFSTCRYCGANIEIDLDVDPKWPRWITTKPAGGYLCGRVDDWVAWSKGDLSAHEPIDEPKAEAEPIESDGSAEAA